MSTSEDDEAFGSDPFGLRDLWERNRGCPNPASAASASAASGALSAPVSRDQQQKNDSSLTAAASGAPSASSSGAPSFVRDFSDGDDREDLSDFWQLAD